MNDSSNGIDRATIESAAAAIRRYLADHPHSADSIEGVAQWWLAQQRLQESVDVVSQALELLTRIGEVKRTDGIDGRVIYSPVSRNAKSN